MRDGKNRKFSWRRLRIDEHARVPFAFVAVIILLMAGFSWAYLSAVNKDEILSKIENKEIRNMDAVCDRVKQEVDTHAHYISHDIIGQANLSEIWDSEDINDLFTTDNRTGDFDNYLDKSYPKTEGDYKITISNYSAAISAEGRQVDGPASDTIIVYCNITGFLNITVTKPGTGYYLHKSVSLDSIYWWEYP